MAVTTMGMEDAGQAAGPVLDVEDLSIWYGQGRTWRPAVQSLSFDIARGEAVGLVGESGSGKSSVAMAVLHYLPKHARVAAARLAFEGREIAGLAPAELRRLRGNRLSAVYQHPGSALNPSLTVGRQIAEPLVEHRKLRWAEARARAEHLLERVHVRDPRSVFDLYPHELSGGMQQRAVIAMALALEPALLVLDEPTTALDASIQSEIIAILDDLRREHRTSLLLISHDIGLIRRATERVGVLQNGVLVELGDTPAVLGRPQHPYTRGLIDSIPAWGFTKERGRLQGGNEATRLDGVPAEQVMPTSRPAVAGGSAKALRCRGISHAFGERRILREVDLDIAPGKTFGLIGESGSGKSTLARIVTGLQEPKEGTVELFGHPVPPRVERRSLEEKRSVQMVFQSPDMTLNPRQRLGRILAGPLRRLAGLRGRAVKARIEALFEGVRLPVDLVFKRPHALSGGQRQRVAIARAFAAAPRLIVLDEPTSALDVSVQATILNLLNDLQKTHGTSFLFISHDLKVVRYMADEIGVLYRGHLVETGPADRVFRGPNHPYTMRLLAASRDGEQIASRRVPGREEDLQSGAGCAFAPQCPVAGERCHHEPPPKRLDGEDHEIVCWLDIEALATGGAAVENPSRSAVS